MHATVKTSAATIEVTAGGILPAGVIALTAKMTFFPAYGVSATADEAEALARALLEAAKEARAAA